ncbi:MAG: hypothetical protein FJ225_08475 [Lentisphaerae bacterium]|nr:hypothetical protein [Lentisphaerota bacterium]
MQAETVRRAVSAAAVMAAFSLFAGCGGPPIKEPTAAQLQAALEGQSIDADEAGIPIDASLVSGFKVVGIFHNEKESTSAARVEFDYLSEDGNYRVQGVISYQRSPTEVIKAPRFEVNELADL